MPSSLDSKVLAITRNNLEAQEFSDLIASEGGRAIPLPTIEIVPKDPSAVDEFIDAVNKNENEYCAFLSPQAVDVLFNHASRICKTEELVSVLNSRIVAAIGPKTKQRLVDHMIDVKMVPERYSSVGLVELFSKMEDQNGKKILIPRSEASNEFVERALSALNMVVNLFFLYTARTSVITPIWNDFILLLEQKKVDAIVFTSASNVRSFFEITQNMPHSISSLLKNVKAVIAIGPMTNEELKKRGIPSFESSEHTIRGTVDLAKIILGK
ncbi:MAG: uroporphyrinogen-III synthase [Candidatus Nitrosopolaris wilkensis]|nr:MAG: uroporphyrinogen-III synthase [Candidatus Nitrosopolaris wilkensis]